MKTKIKATNEYNLQVGTKIIFTPTKKEFIISNVTDKRVSWRVDAHTSSWGKNTMKFAWTSLSTFNEGVRNGCYKII